MKTKIMITLVATVIFCVSFWFIYTFPERQHGSDDKNGTYYEVTVISQDGEEKFHYHGKCYVDFSPESVYFVLQGEDGTHEVVLLDETDRVHLVEKEEDGNV